MLEGALSPPNTSSSSSAIPASHPSNSYVEVRPTDVLLGRGPKVYDNPGNVAFRLLCQRRRAEYEASKTLRQKHVVAQRIVDEIRRGDDGNGDSVGAAAAAESVEDATDAAAGGEPRTGHRPGGRFLREARPGERAGPQQQQQRERQVVVTADGSQWIPAENEVALEKCKQTFRDLRKIERAAAAAAPSSARAGGLDGASAAGKVERGAKNKAKKKKNTGLASASTFQTAFSYPSASPIVSAAPAPAGLLLPAPTAEMISQPEIPPSVAVMPQLSHLPPIEPPPVITNAPNAAACLGSATTAAAAAAEPGAMAGAYRLPCSDVLVPCAPGTGHGSGYLDAAKASVYNAAPDAYFPSPIFPGSLDQNLRTMAFESQQEPIPEYDANSPAIQDVLPFSINPTSIKEGLRVSEAMELTDPNIIGAEQKSSDERTGLLYLVCVASELVSTLQKGRDTKIVHRSHECLDSFLQCTDQTRSDLVSLGSALYRHFAGVGPFDGRTAGCSSDGERARSARAEQSSAKAGQWKKKERRSESRHYERLRDLGFPVSLCALVSNLLDAQDDCAPDRYHALDEVQIDLHLMIADPERHLFDAGADNLKGGKLELPRDKLYGRDQEVSILMDVFDRVILSDKPSEIVLISGYSGTGKSVLVDQLRQPLAERNGHFISGKFDQWGQNQPMSVIFTAFDDFCSKLLECDEGHISQIRSAVATALGPNVNVLTGLIPNLSTVMGDNSPPLFHIGGREALNRFLHHFRLFVRAIASTSHPVIVFLDDLQWADKSSLDLITTLVSDRESSSLLFVGCYRDNEVAIDHPLNDKAGNAAFAGVTTTKIELENIDRESVNALLSDAVHLSPRLSRSLAHVVHAKTGGNPLFIVQFLRSLCDEGSFRYSARTRQWEWDIEAIQSRDIADNVVGLFSEKMIRLDPGVQKLLKESACLGSRFEVSTLNLLSSDFDNGSGIERSLNLAVDEGLMCRIGPSYKFSHDLIKQAAYSLIPASEREVVHLDIGRLLWKRASESELRSILSIVIDQLQRGSDFISDHDEKVKVAELCLMAGQQALSSSAFMQASMYLLQGTTLLDESDWEHHYDLCLELFSSCAEAQYITGNHEGVMLTSNVIMKRGSSIQDKIGTYYTMLHSLGSQGKQLDALNIGLDVATKLGQCFPSDIRHIHIMTNFAKTQFMLWKTSIDGILQMKEMKDTNMVAAMKLFSAMSRHAYQLKQKLASMMIFRMVQLSLCHGVCSESALGFASFGSFLCRFGKYTQGYSFGKLALSLLDRFQAKEHLARVYVVVYGMVFIFTQPVQAVLPSLKHGYETAMALGDIEWALANANVYLFSALQCGSNLEALAEEANENLRLMKELNQYAFMLDQPYLATKGTSALVQTIFNLLGCSDDPIILTGEAMNQEDLVNSALDEHIVAFRVCFFRMWLAYLFRKYELAAEMVKRIQEMTIFRPIRLKTPREIFYTGLTAAAMAQESDEGEWRNTALDAAKDIKTLAAISTWNFQHMVHLMNAEIMCINGDLDGAAEEYDDSIRVAGEHGFVHEQALACERAGIFHSEKFNALKSTDYFKQSHKCYVQWGAKRKANDLLSFIDDKAWVEGTDAVTRS